MKDELQQSNFEHSSPINWAVGGSQLKIHYNQHFQSWFPFHETAFAIFTAEKRKSLHLKLMNEHELGL